MSQFAEKSILAKLLATENINVEHQKVTTAYFDLQNRTVVLPIFKEMSADLYDLLIGHEVGHALETPADGWHDAICERGSGFKSFLNIIEDARIERKMKDRYPGIRRSFFNGYKELFEKNFFGVEGMDLTKLKFIDRINLHAKVGAFLNIQFSAEEQAYVDRIDSLQTWDDVVALATELYERAETSTEESEFEQMLDALANAMQDGEGDESDEFDPTAEQIDVPAPSPSSEQEDTEEETDGQSDGGESSDDADETAEDDASGAADGESDETAEDGAEDGTSASDGAGKMDSDVEPSSFTDQNFRQNEDSLVDTSARETLYAKLPTFKPADYVVGINTVEKMLQFELGGSQSVIGKTVDQVKMELYKSFLQTNSKYLSAMAQDFERKKKAQSLMRAQTSKTGRINMDKIWAHKITEDLFLQNTVIPNGQNHGMILYLDMSGSMSGSMVGTTEQLVLLASFCQKVRIPFEVYGFISNGGAPHSFTSTIGSRNNKSDSKNLLIQDGNFRMLQLVTTGVSGAKFKTQMANLLALGKAYDRHYHGLYLTSEASSAFGLGSTPLEEAIMVGRYIAEDFKARNRIEVLSSVFLTDGQGDASFDMVDRQTSYRKNLAVTDSKTRRTFVTKRDDGGYYYRDPLFSETLLNLYKSVTGSRVINFYLINQYDFKHFVSRSGASYADQAAARKTFRKEGAAVLKNTNGFDDQFLIKSGRALQVTEDTLTVESNDKKELMKAFKSFQGQKAMGRVVLTKMVEAVA